jgi:hypothetical protein
LRRQSRHRQSSPSSGIIGRRAVSSAHQHGPARRQVNSVPQREQLRRREAGISNLFVINPTELRGEVLMSGSCRTALRCPSQYTRWIAQGKSDGPRQRVGEADKGWWRKSCRACVFRWPLGGIVGLRGGSASNKTMSVLTGPARE